MTAIDPMTLLTQIGSPEVRADPMPLYRQIAAMPTGAVPGLHFAATHELCSAILRDDERFGRAEAATDGDFLSMNPPDHTRLRAMVSRPFTPRALRAWEQRVQMTVDEILDRVKPKGEMDVVADFAYPTPLTVICEMFGAPASDHDQLRAWSRAIVPMLDPITLSAEEAAAAADADVAFRDWAMELAAVKRDKPGDDLLTDLVRHFDAGEMTDRELSGNCELILGAGHETTVNLISAGLLSMLRDGRAWEQLVADPDGVAASATEELMRFCSPVQFTGRSAMVDLDLTGLSMKRGEEVFVMLALANRDTEAFDEPDQLDVTRQNNKQIGFGFGIHHCLGAQLARLEGAIAFASLAKRLPNMRIVEEPAWRKTIVLRGLESLRVEW